MCGVEVGGIMVRAEVFCASKRFERSAARAGKHRPFIHMLL